MKLCGTTKYLTSAVQSDLEPKIALHLMIPGKLGNVSEFYKSGEYAAGNRSCTKRKRWSQLLPGYFAAMGADIAEQSGIFVNKERYSCTFP